MKIVYISSYCNRSLYEEFYKQNGKRLSSPAYNFNRKIIEGLESNGVNVLKFVSFSSKNRDKEFFIFEGNSLLYFYKMYKKLVEEHHQGDFIIVGDALCAKAMLCATIFKLLYKVKIISIVTDLPEYVGTFINRSLASRFFEIVTKAIIKKSDGLVCLTKEIANRFKGNNDSLIIEGFAEDFKLVKSKIDLKTIEIVYAGSIQEEYGIVNLMKAINEIGCETVKLSIYSTDEKYTEFNNEISNYVVDRGFVSFEKIPHVLVGASILVNPRPIDAEYTKYSFPSKLIEYLSSGTITITTKLPGIGTDYDDYINYFRGSSVAEIKAGVLDLIENIDFYQNKAIRAKEYVLKCKHKKVQAKKILNLINQLNN